MKLFQSTAALIGSASALQRGLDPAQSIAFAHSRVRQGFLIKEMNNIIDENERLLREVFEPDFNQRLISLDEMVSRSENITTSFRKQGNCDSSFPTYDGSCNHVAGKGRSMQKYARLVPASYCDGKQEPRCAKNGGSLPDERKISLAMSKNRSQNADNVASTLFTAWGQFLTHDIIQTPDVGQGNVPCDCSPNKSCVNIRLQNDPKLRFKCMFIIRSSGALGNNGGQPIRDQFNQQTAFIDGSVVYGFNDEHRKALTHPNGRHLLMEENNKFGSFLPDVNNKKFGNSIKNKFETADVFNDKGHDEFVAGDTRVLENPVLSSYHTLFARLHNEAADAFTEMNKDWSASRVFEESRLFVMSCLKFITYEEHLKVLLGPNQIAKIDGLKVPKAERKRPRKTRFAKPLGPNHGSRNTGHSAPSADDPTIRQEFVTAAFRYGHAQIGDMLNFAGANLGSSETRRMKDNYFDPDGLFKHGPGGCLRGAMMQKTNSVSGTYADSTQHNLFKPADFEHGVDLLSINLARGRDHGVGGYEEVKAFCRSHQKFGAFYNGEPKMLPGWDAVRSLFAHKDDIDLYAGLLMEEHMNGAQVGPTAGCIIGEQFVALKRGDIFWIDNHGVLSNDQLHEVKTLGLGKLMCNMLENMSKVAELPFVQANVNFDGKKNSIVPCSKLGKINFEAWRQGAKPTNAPATTQSPDEPGTTVKPTGEPINGPGDTEEITHAEVACQLVDKRNKLVQCGGSDNPWTNEHVKALLDWMESKNGFPRRGKRTIIMNQPANTVLRVSFANNPEITDTKLMKRVVAFLKNMIELDMRNIGLTDNLDSDFFADTPRIANVNLAGTKSGCWSEDLIKKLQSNMKTNIRMFKNRLLFAN